MDYRREIDGLRALAVVAVILFHAGFETFSGGFVGVDVFFVISGYLITTIILVELERGTFSIAGFYERRARRILPALFIVMLVCLPFAWFWLLPSDMKEFSRSLVAVSVFASNFLFLRNSGYFDSAAELKPLLHTWSLAVEEQYYIFFPLLLMLSWRLGKRWLLVLLGIVGIASLALAQWASLARPAVAFYVLITRGWELLIGAFAAFYLANKTAPAYTSRYVAEVAGWSGLLLMMFSVLSYNRLTPFPGFYALVPTVGTVLIILFANQETAIGRFVGNKALVGVGLISYSAYLWHQPIFAFARHQTLIEPDDRLFAVLSIAALVLAYFSWKYVERPFRNKVNFSRARIFIYSLAGSMFFVLVGMLGDHYNNRIESYWIERLPREQKNFYTRLIAKDLAVANFGANSAGAQDLGGCRFNASELTVDIEQRIVSCREKHGPGVLVLGDSHAIDLFGVLASRFNDDFLIGITNAGCRPHTPLPECQYSSVRSFVRKNHSVFKHVIYEQAGFYLLLDSRGEEGTRRMFSHLRYGDVVSGISVDLEHINRTLDYLIDLSVDVPVTWFLPRLEPHINKNTVLRKGCGFNWEVRPGLKEVFSVLDETIADTVRDRNNDRIKIVSQNAILGFGFPSDFLNCNDIYWSDGDHLSSSGEVRFGKRLPSDFLEY